MPYRSVTKCPLQFFLCETASPPDVVLCDLELSPAEKVAKDLGIFDLVGDAGRRRRSQGVRVNPCFKAGAFCHSYHDPIDRDAVDPQFLVDREVSFDRVPGSLGHRQCRDGSSSPPGLRGPSILADGGDDDLSFLIIKP